MVGSALPDQFLLLLPPRAPMRDFLAAPEPLPKPKGLAEAFDLEVLRVYYF